jgi:small subunit ribosomal protein S6
LKKTKRSNLNDYECLLILDAAVSEDAEKVILDRVAKDIQGAGGKVDEVQKLGQRPFARVLKNRSAGNYTNIVFHAPAKAVAELDAKFHLDTELFRWLIIDKPAPPEPRKPRVKKDKEAAAAPARA